LSGFSERVSLIIAVFLALSLITGIIFLSMRWQQLRPVEIVLTNTTNAPAGDIVVSGAVSRPGIYTTRPEDTLTSLISAAGPTDNSDMSGIQIYVPGRNQIIKPQKIDLNRAEIWLLGALPGIGEGKARQIVDYRVKNGPFRSMDDLLKIEGFGKSTVDKIRNYVTIGD
jgi:competence protein ComEA